MNKRYQLIVEMEKGGEVSVQINGTGADALVSLAILAADVCEVAKIPTAAFAMTLGLSLSPDPFRPGGLLWLFGLFCYP